MTLVREEPRQFTMGIHTTAERLTDQLPEHQRFIDHYRKLPT